MTDDTDTEWIEVPQDALVQHAIALALEAPSDNYEILNEPEDPEWSLRDMSVESVGVTEDGDVRIHGIATDSETECVSRGSRHHPPEYKSHEVLVHLTLTLELTANHGLGEVTVWGECEGGIPRPDPDVHAHQYDEL